MAEGESRMSVATPPPNHWEGGTNYAAKGIAVSIFTGGCEDEASRRRYDEAVFVTVGDREYGGCGGALRPADSLADTGWMIDEIAGAKVRSPNMALDFGAERFVAYSGCNRIDGEYSRSGETLTITIKGRTLRRCSEPLAGCEQLFWQILAKPVKVELADWRTLALVGPDGTIRLHDPDKNENIFKTDIQPCPTSAD